MQSAPAGDIPSTEKPEASSIIPARQFYYNWAGQPQFIEGWGNNGWGIQNGWGQNDTWTDWSHFDVPKDPFFHTQEIWDEDDEDDLSDLKVYTWVQFHGPLDGPTLAWINETYGPSPFSLPRSILGLTLIFLVTSLVLSAVLNDH